MSRCWLSLVLIGGWGSAAAGGSASVVLHCGPTLTAQKRMEWHIFSLNCKPSLILVSIHYIFVKYPDCANLIEKMHVLQKVVLNTEFSPGFFLQDSWGFLKASKEEQRQRSKVRPEGYLIQVVSSKKSRAYKWANSTVWWFGNPAVSTEKDVGGFLKWWVSPTTNYWFSY